VRFALDPYFACLLFAGVALGTLALAVGPRLIVLWVTLLGLWLVYREGQAIRLEYRLVDVGRGAGIGLLVSVPVVALAFRGLTTAIPILYVGGKDPAAAVVSGTTVFATLVVLAPLAEELFFRDILQKERGFWTAVAFYAIGGVLFFLPTAGSYLVVLVAVSGATAVLGVIYAFLYRRYGLTAALACHAAANLILLCIPATLSHLELFAR
jgi:membrane protease YdiL (CAAX protease family)